MAIKKGTGIESLKKQIHTQVKITKKTGSETAAVITPENPIPDGPKQKERKLKFLRLNITDYQDYISLMAGHATNTSGKYVSMTQYILRLIEADKQQNISLYEKLEQIENMKRELV